MELSAEAVKFTVPLPSVLTAATTIKFVGAVLLAAPASAFLQLKNVKKHTSIIAECSRYFIVWDLRYETLDVRR